MSHYGWIVVCIVVMSFFYEQSSDMSFVRVFCVRKQGTHTMKLLSIDEIRIDGSIYFACSICTMQMVGGHWSTK